MSKYLKLYRWHVPGKLTALVVAPSVGEAWCVLRTVSQPAYGFLSTGLWALTEKGLNLRLSRVTIPNGFPVRPREISLGFCTDESPERSSLWRDEGGIDPPRREFYGEVFWH